MATSIISRFRFALNADARTFNREMRTGRRSITDQERAMRQLQRTVRNTGERFTRFQRQVFSLRGALVSIAAVGGFLRLAQESTRAATALVELSDRSGFTVERLQTLGRVFEGDGVSADQFNRAIGRMNDVMNDARNGLSTARVALSQINLEFSDLEGLSPEEQFEAIANGVANLATESERAGVVRDIFGARAEAFINVLQRGTDSIREQEAVLAQLGVTSRSDAEALKALNQEFTNISTTLQVSLQQAFADSADELRDLLVSLQDLIRTGTPIAIDATSFATRTLTSVSESPNAALTAVGGVLAGRGLAGFGRQLTTAATALGRSTGLLASFGTRLAALAGPAGILVSVIGTMLLFRRQLTEFARNVDTDAVQFSSQVPDRNAPPEVLREEIARLTSVLEELPNVFENATNIQQSQLAIREFARQNLSEENFESINRLFNDAIRGDIRGGRGLEINQEKLLELTNDVLEALIAGLTQRLGPLEQRAEEDAAAQREQERVAERVAAEDAEQLRLNQLAEEQRAEQERINAELRLRREIILGVVDAEQDIVNFLRDVATETQRGTIAEERIRDLLIEQQDITARINQFRRLGFIEDADNLVGDLTRVNVQLERMQQLVDLGIVVNVSAPQSPIIQNIEAIGSIVGEDGLSVFNQENLEAARAQLDIILANSTLLPETYDELDDHLRANQVRLRTLGESTQDWLTSMREGLSQIIVYTDDWGEALERLGRLAITNVISSFFTEDRLRGIFTGRQFGGAVNANQGYLVGESGPELFVPRTAGEIVSNRDLNGFGGVTINMTNNINSTDGPGVRRALAQFGPEFRRDILKSINSQNATISARNRGAR